MANCMECAHSNVCRALDNGDDYIKEDCAEYLEYQKIDGNLKELPHSIAYLCKECGEGNTCPQDGSTCSYDMCKHTTDVKYAKNFVQVDDNSYMEVCDDDQKRWTPCVSVKPEPYRDVIFCDLDGGIYKGSMYDNGDWYDDAYDDPVKNVVAWMPLPESYKGGDKNETIKPA